jgi:penicillin-binding protein 2
MQESRKYIILGFIALIASIYLVKLFYLQVVDDSYGAAADANAIEPVVQIPPRGQVYDRSGKLIVYNTPVYDLYVTPKKAVIPDTARFCTLLDLTRTEFDSLMGIARSYSRHKASLFLRQLSVEDFARIQDAMVDYPGFSFETSSFRTYTSPSLANSLGYIAEVSPKQLEEQEERGESYYRQGDYIGKSGLEKQYEEILRGRRGIKYIMKDVKGVVKGPWRGGEKDVQPIAGKNLYTSIDLEVQQYADSLFKNKMGSLVAIDPKTGEILALASSPTYDPKLLSGRQYSKNYARLALDPYKPLINRTLQGSYRPGSTFKLIQSLVALQMGAITPGTAYSHGGAPMKCHGHPSLSGLHSAVQFSCNPYYYHVFRKVINENEGKNLFQKAAIGLERWGDHVAKFGIGQKLGVDLPYEAKGKLPDVAYYNKVYKGEMAWKFSNIYSLSIGEGELLISPMKMANVAAIIANRGWYITPHVVRAIGTPNGKPLPEYQVRHEVGVEARHFEPVIEGMQGAVERGTTSRRAIVPGIAICGKTGTSQNKRGKDSSIFICFAPRDNPRIAVACFVDNGGFGGVAAGPIATFVVEKYLNRKIDPSRKSFETQVIETNYIQNVPMPTLKPDAKPKPTAPKDSAKAPKPLLAKIR